MFAVCVSEHRKERNLISKKSVETQLRLFILNNSAVGRQSATFWTVRAVTFRSFVYRPVETHQAVNGKKKRVAAKMGKNCSKWFIQHTLRDNMTERP